MRFPYFLPSFYLLAASVCAIGPYTNLHIANKFLQPDGFNRSTVLAGATKESLAFPGPPITGFKGDKFAINVIDELTDKTMFRSTSIHWHGLFQEKTNYADGPVGVSQCPIIPGNSFLYQFSVPDQAGTFWYHSHHKTEYCDGLRGAFVVYDADDPYKNFYDFDNEQTIITLADWYHAPSPAAGDFPTANSTLINGLGRFTGGPNSPLAVINISPGKRYRFRLVSISCDPSFQFSIDGHKMTIIETDGNNVTPLVVDSIDIFVGQRYSFILTANQPVSNYWVRALPGIASATFNEGVNSAILRYEGAPDIEPTTVDTSNDLLVETNLHSLTNPAAPGIPILRVADVNMHFNISGALAKGRWNEAEQLQVQVMDMSKKLLGTDHPDTLISMANLAATYWIQGRWNKAEQLQVQVMDTRKKLLGAEHPDTLTSMADLATTYLNQGRWNEAEQLQVQVMDMSKKLLGTDHPDTLTSMANLATTYWIQGRWNKAEQLQVQVMDTRKKLLGAEHPDTLTCMADLATTYLNQGRWNEAEQLQVQVMDTRKKLLGAEHPDTLTSMENLAVTYGDQGRWNEAEQLQVQVVDMRKKLLGAEHPHTLTSMKNLAATYEDQRRQSEA